MLLHLHTHHIPQPFSHDTSLTVIQQDDCRQAFWEVSGHRDCLSAEWDCNCKYGALFDHLACCMSWKCNATELAKGDDKLRGYCERTIQATIPSLLECNATTSRMPGTLTGSATLSVSSQTGTPEVSMTEAVTTSSEVGQETADSETEEEPEENPNDDGSPSHIGLGAGLGIGVSFAAGVFGLLGFIIWKRRQRAREKKKNKNDSNNNLMEHSPASPDGYKFSPLQEKRGGEDFELEAPGPPLPPVHVVVELSPECRIAELPG